MRAHRGGVRALGRRFALVLALAAGALAGCSAGNPYYDPSKPHHRPEGFVNSNPVSRPPEVGFFEQLRRQFTGYYRPKAPPAGGYEAFAKAWSVSPQTAMLRANRDRTTVTWLGHASILLQVGGLNLLMDPVFSDRASPLTWTGPERRVPAPMPVADLPALDAVLITHNHYDHLDLRTVHELARRQPGLRFVVALGMKPWFEAQGIGNVTQLDWWDQLRLGPLTLTFTPAQHWSRRTLFDRNESLWGGFLVEAPEAGSRPWRFLYTGDTGYSDDFKAIHQRVGEIDLVAVPVGAYEPRDFMQPQHTNPEEAVRILLDLRARAGFGVHWGTFELTQEPFDQPPRDLDEARRRLGVPAERFFLLKHGETRVLRP